MPLTKEEIVAAIGTDQIDQPELMNRLWQKRVREAEIDTSNPFTFEYGIAIGWLKEQFRNVIIPMLDNGTVQYGLDHLYRLPPPKPSKSA